MENSPSAEADTAQPASAPSEKQEANNPSASSEKDADPPLSKNQLKKRRRWEKAQSIKKRRKEQARELKRIKAKNAGRDLDAERRQQLQNEKEGTGWKRREERWKEILQKADIDNSFRVCLDCSFEDQMTSKEMNSLGLQLRYAYAVNRKSAMPVHIDVCGLKKGGETRGHLEKVEGFPERWVGRAFRCYEDEMEEVYCKSIEVANGVTSTNPSMKCDGNAQDGKKSPIISEDKTSAAKSEVKTSTDSEDKASTKNGDVKASIKSEKEPEDTENVDSNKDATDNVSDLPYPKLRPNHKFVYLTGDSPNTLTSLDNNTTYIIGGIVDRNRLKRAAIERAESINSQNTLLSIQTARLPLDENLDFKGSTRILTCNHVFEILQRYRENGYEDWRGSVMAVLPCRKDVEEKVERNDEVKANMKKVRVQVLL